MCSIMHTLAIGVLWWMGVEWMTVLAGERLETEEHNQTEAHY